MKCIRQRLIGRASVIAVHCALLMLAAVPASRAQDAGEETRQLKQDANSIEVGAGNVDRGSAKFGEYNGLSHSGGHALGNFQLYGGDGDKGTGRWNVRGSILSPDTRNLQGEVGEQGNYRLSFGYDEFRRVYSGDYKTIWQGAGSTALTLPSSYPAASTRVSSTSSANATLSNWNNIQAPCALAATCASGAAANGPAYIIPGLMQGFEVGTKRTRYDLGYAKSFRENWEFQATARHELKEGTKLTGVAMNRFSGPSALLPEPVSYSTDQVDASFRYAAARGQINFGYSGSMFRNAVNVWTADYAGAGSTTPVPGNVSRMVGAPDNQMHQLNMTGAYNFSNTTRLVASGSYARLTQNESFLAVPTGATWVLPETSANAKVINTSFMARLTARPARNLGLNASYKYDDRDNRTPAHDFLVTADTTAASSQFSNEPNQRRSHQVNLEGDYSLGRGQAVKAGYQWQEIRRRGQTYEETPFSAEKVRENTLQVQYRNSLAERATGRISYAHSLRRASAYRDGDPAPVQSLPSPPAPGADPLLPGFRQVWLADRNRDKLRGVLNFQPAETLSMQAGLDYNYDKYPSSTYGVKESKSWSFSLDGAYAATEKFSLNAYYNYEDKSMRLDSLAISRGLSDSVLVAHVSGGSCASYAIANSTAVPPSGEQPSDYYTDSCRQWSESQKDRIHTFGVGFKSRGLMQNKLELTGNLTWSRAVTPISVTGGTYYSNSVTSGAPSRTTNVYVPAQSFDDITSRMTDLRLDARYALDKVSSLKLTWLHRRLSSSDWQYDAYTNSSLGVLAIQGYIGPGMTSPNYTVNVVGLSYIHEFK